MTRLVCLDEAYPYLNMIYVIIVNERQTFTVTETLKFFINISKSLKS